MRLTDILPANLIAITYTSSGAALTPVGLSPYTWQVANLAPGAGGLVTVTGVLSGGLHGTAFTNTATINTASSDANSANNTSAVSVTVANVAPVATGDAYTLPANSTLTAIAPGVLVNDIDANNDVLTANLTTGPLTGTLGLHVNGSFTYTPPLGFGGLVTFTYQASDGLLLSAPATVTLVVNQPPIADAGPSQIKFVGQPVALDGSASYDPDNYLPLAYGWKQSGGTAVVLSSATISRPTFTAPGAPGVLTFTLTVSDAYGLASLPATNTVTVTDQAILGLSAAGGSPRVLGSATPFTATISVGTNVTYSWGFGDGSSPAMGALVSHTYGLPGAFQAVVTATNSVGQIMATTTVTVTDQAITGLSAASNSPTVFGQATAFTASVTAGTNVSYAWGFGNGATGNGPNPNYIFPAVGLHSVVVTATNSAGQVSATTTVTVDDIPLAASDAYTTPEDEPLLVPAPGVLANDSDAFPGGLVAQRASGPTTGLLALAPNGRFTYTAPANFHGLVTFTYRASDGTLSSPAATVTITVASVNDPPTLTAPADVTTTAGTPVGPLGFSIGDVDGDPLTVTAQSGNTVLVPNGSIVLGGSGANRTMTLTPTAGLTGTATITLSVSDGLAVTNKAFTVTVTAEYKLYLPLLAKQ